MPKVFLIHMITEEWRTENGELWRNGSLSPFSILPSPFPKNANRS